MKIILKEDASAVAEAAIGLWSDTARQALKRQGVFRVALSGGKTPELMFRLMALRGMPWDKTEVFWVDERYVPPGHAESNYGLARELLLDNVPIPKDKIHPIPTDSGDPAHDAAAYEALLKKNIPPYIFDLCLLGLGEDGHTASLFTEGPELAEKQRWVVASRSPEGVADRITLTIPAICKSALKIFVVCGLEKSDVVRAVLGPLREPPLPAQLVGQGAGNGVFLLDREAASQASSIDDGQ